MIKNIIIDLDNTIFNTTQAEEMAYEKTLQEVIPRLEQPREPLLAFKEIISKIRHRPQEVICAEDRLLYFSEIFRHYPPPLGTNRVEHILTTFRLFNETLVNNLSCYDGVKEFLMNCKKKGIKVIGGTNNLLQPQLHRVNNLGIADYFFDIISCQEAGCKKPSSDFFNFILKKWDIATNETAMIGDNPKTDGGASKLGIKCFIFSPKDQNGQTCEFHRFKKFQELEEIIND